VAQQYGVTNLFIEQSALRLRFCICFAQLNSQDTRALLAEKLQADVAIRFLNKPDWYAGPQLEPVYGKVSVPFVLINRAVRLLRESERPQGLHRNLLA
jgi:hypothetical protein